MFYFLPIILPILFFNMLNNICLTMGKKQKKKEGDKEV